MGESWFLAAEPAQRLTDDLRLALVGGTDQLAGTEAIEVELPPEVLDESSGIKDAGQERSRITSAALTTPAGTTSARAVPSTSRDLDLFEMVVP